MAGASEIPLQVLSEHFQEQMSGKRLLSAVFLTFRFDPAFFEQDLLPVFLDVPLSHATEIRLVQLEDALRALNGHLAVYYDANGLELGDSVSAKLDVRRIPLRHRTGIFHPKNVFLLVESVEPDPWGEHERQLLVASLSANLTRPGWWENVEVCHVEVIAAEERTRLREDLLTVLRRVQRLAPDDVDHAALEHVRSFLRATESITRRSSGGRFHPRFYSGTKPVPDFLEGVVGKAVRNMHLEVLSPYFDVAGSSKPLEDLIERFEPRRVRVLLPREADGSAGCSEEIYQGIAELPGVEWGNLPDDLMSLGRSDDAGKRRVHAKVYRFFSKRPKREILFVGSPNLTNAAHTGGGNFETGFLVEIKPPRQPEYWLVSEEKEPTAFQARREDEGAATSDGTPLCIRFDWSKHEAAAFWNDMKAPPRLRLRAHGVELFALEGLPIKEWVLLAGGQSERLRGVLARTAFLEVAKVPKAGTDIDEDAWAILLVQEEGMSHKPSLLMQLSVTDILRYWSLLTVEQRNAFLEAHANELALTGEGADLVTAARRVKARDTMFDRFAGFFHAFGSLERSLDKSLGSRQQAERNGSKAQASGCDREAVYRLFGKKYDSLGCLLARVIDGSGPTDPVDQYVIVLCARQLLRQVKRNWPDFWREHAAEARDIERTVRWATEIRERLSARNDADMEAFLDWFEGWFLKRASEDPPEEAKG